ncbi:MAG: peptide ABC transporter substrate-binding protein [Candidatus Cybelea sp.]
MPSARSTRLLLLTAAIACAACSHFSSVQRAAPHELRIADWAEPSSLDPLLAHDQDTIGFDLLFVQTLVGVSRDNRLVPILLTRVPSRINGDISADGRTIVYHLRPNVRFADGTMLTSADVAFTFGAIMDPRNPVLSQDAYRRIESLSTPDARTVIIRLRSPWNAAVRELFAQSDFAFGILPAHAFAGTSLQRAPWEDHAFGSGPFRVTEWRRGDRIVLEPNPYFSPRPKLRRIELRMISDLNAAMVALRTREADATRIGAHQVPEISADPQLRVLATDINGFASLGLQTTVPPTDDVHVRRAIAAALDVPLIERANHNLFARGAAFLPPVLTWHDATLTPSVHNAGAAASELDAAGWRLKGKDRMRSGAPLEVLIVAQAGSGIGLDAIVQQELAAVGIRATVKTFPASSYNGPNGPLRTGRFNIATGAWIGGADPEQSVTFACSQIGPNGNNIARFCDRRFEAAFADQAVTPDIRRRRDDFRTMQRIVYEQMPVIPLDYERYFDAVNVRVTGFARNMLGYPVNAETWDVK